MHIPKIFHQIWLDWGKGKPNPPPVYLEWTEHLKALNPEWRYMYWQNENSRNFIKEHYSWFLKTYDGYDKWIKRVDALRYFLLDYYGGLYVDFDTEPLKALDPLLEGCDIVVGEEYGKIHFINNDFMASVPHHPFWKDLQQRLVVHRNNENVIESTGPALLTEAILDYKKKNPSPYFKVYGNQYFHPIGPDQAQSQDAKDCAASIEKCKEIFPSAFSVSQYAGTWH